MTLSREEKNKELHEKLMSDPESEVKSNDLEKFANRLNQIDQNNFNQMNTEKTSDNPQHVSSYADRPVVQPSFFDDVKVENPEKNVSDYNDPLPKFNNEYLDEFLQEVKAYNIKKGNRTYEDTSASILHDLNSKEEEKTIVMDKIEMPKETVKEPVFERFFSRTEERKALEEPETNKEEKQVVNDISEPVEKQLDIPVYGRAIQNATQVLNETEVKDMIEEEKPNIEETFKSEELKLEIEKLLNNEELSNPESISNDEVTQEILAQTSSLKKQMEDYDTKLSKVDKRMARVNKSLNIILIILFMALLGLLGVIVYYVLKSKGIL